MRRLRELEAHDPMLSRARELIEAVGPTVPSEARKQRVRRALDQPVRPSRRPWGLRGALAFAVLGAGATALAFSGAFSRPAEPPPRGALKSTVAPPPAPKPSPPVAAPNEPSEEAVPTTKPRVASHARRSEPAATPSANESDVARVHEAAKALRGDGDPKRALRLLEPSDKVNGPLAEEALALRIEAANAARDPRAKPLARSYLSRYPDGRYRELARRTLSVP